MSKRELAVSKYDVGCSEYCTNTPYCTIVNRVFSNCYAINNEHIILNQNYFPIRVLHHFYIPL
jgi:hypothetical protein